MSQEDSQFVINFIDGPLKGKSRIHEGLHPIRVAKPDQTLLSYATSRSAVTGNLKIEDYYIKTYIHREISSRTIPMIKPSRFCEYDAEDFDWLRYCRLAKSEPLVIDTRFHIASCTGFPDLKFSEDWSPTEAICHIPFKSHIDWHIAPWVTLRRLLAEFEHAKRCSSYFNSLQAQRLKSARDQIMKSTLEKIERRIMTEAASEALSRFNLKAK